MTNHLFISVIGQFLVDDNGEIKEKHLFNSLEDYQEAIEKKEHFLKKHNAREASLEIASKLLIKLKSQEFLGAFRKINLMLAKEKIKASVNEDNLISQAINSIAETEKATNLLVKRLREWYSLYLPEFSESVSNNEKFTELIMHKGKSELMKELKLHNSMGADLKEKDVKQILTLAKQLDALFKYKDHNLEYIDILMKEYCPNLREVAGTTVGAKLIEHTGSLKRLVMIPSSTLQVLGAEKALFRHIKTGARPPKYGLIFEHKFIQTAKKSEQGKRARALADKISMAVRIDYFKGKFMGDALNKQLNDKFLLGKKDSKHKGDFE